MSLLPCVAIHHCDRPYFVLRSLRERQIESGDFASGRVYARACDRPARVCTLESDRKFTGPVTSQSAMAAAAAAAASTGGAERHTITVPAEEVTFSEVPRIRAHVRHTRCVWMR